VFHERMIVCGPYGAGGSKDGDEREETFCFSAGAALGVVVKVKDESQARPEKNHLRRGGSQQHLMKSAGVEAEVKTPQDGGNIEEKVHRRSISL
jgi:hypothetical protein